MEIKHLRTLIAVAKSESFSRAAEKTGFVQSSISAQIKTLEEELGVRLFERLGRRVYLTDKGNALLKYAEKITSLEQEAIGLISAAENQGGAIRIGAAETLCVSYLPPVLREYRRCYPDVKVSLCLSTASKMCASLISNEIDIAFLIDRPIISASLSNEALFEEDLLMLASPENEIRVKSPISPQDLNMKELILTESGSYRLVLEELLASSGVEPCSIMESASIEAIKQLVASGLGITLLPRAMVRDELKNGDLVDIGWRGPGFGIQSQMVLHKDKWLSPALEAFTALARAHAERHS